MMQKSKIKYRREEELQFKEKQVAFEKGQNYIK